MSSVNQEASTSIRYVLDVPVHINAKIEPYEPLLVQLPEPRLDPRIFAVVQLQTLTFSQGSIYVCETLLDMDRVNNSIYLFNASSFAITLDNTITVQLFVYYDSLELKPLYSDNVFFQSNEFQGDKIKYFSKTTKGANGLDIGFEKKYWIPACGHLSITLPFRTKEYYNRPHTVVLRSRFAKQGIVIHKSTEDSYILINNTPTAVFLNSRFIQFIYEPYFAFDIRNRVTSTGDNIKVGEFVENGITKPFPCYFNDKERSCKT